MKRGTYLLRGLTGQLLSALHYPHAWEWWGFSAPLPTSNLPWMGPKDWQAGAPSASVNEPHSFPAAGIWHVIVLGHRGRSDAICWHVLPQHRLPIPLCPRKQQKLQKGSQNLHSFLTHARGARSWKIMPSCCCARLCRRGRKLRTF